MAEAPCPVCGGESEACCTKYDRFGGRYEYRQCQACRFLFDKQLTEQPLRLMTEKIAKVYTPDYSETIDVGWKIRADELLDSLYRFLRYYSRVAKVDSVLDYGAGNAYLAAKVGEHYPTHIYDVYTAPIYGGNYTIETEFNRLYTVIYAIEVVEHLYGIASFENILAHIELNGMFIFSTSLVDEVKPEALSAWAYINPDAGHISIHSEASLALLAQRHRFTYLRYPPLECIHIFIKTVSPLKVSLLRLMHELWKLKNRRREQR